MLIPPGKLASEPNTPLKILVPKSVPVVVEIVVLAVPKGFPIGPGFPFSVPFGLNGVEVSVFLGSIGGFTAIISTTKGVPLEFHVSRSSADINMAYGTKSFPIYNTTNIPAMTIDANNNVGIGTNNPLYKLHVKLGTLNDVALFESTDLHLEI